MFYNQVKCVAMARETSRVSIPILHGEGSVNHHLSLHTQHKPAWIDHFQRHVTFPNTVFLSAHLAERLTVFQSKLASMPTKWWVMVCCLYEVTWATVALANNCTSPTPPDDPDSFSFGVPRWDTVRKENVNFGASMLQILTVGIFPRKSSACNIGDTTCCKKF